MAIFKDDDITEADIYNFQAMRSSFYDEVKYSSKSMSTDLGREEETKNTRGGVRKPYRDDWTE